MAPNNTRTTRTTTLRNMLQMDLDENDILRNEGASTRVGERESEGFDFRFFSNSIY
jgi:hypothetical protein